jgi:Secretion system C-terminal sorting domain
MKKIVLVLVVLSFWGNLKSQSYLALPDSNATWIIQQDDGFAGFYWRQYSLPAHKQDTIINLRTYTKFPNVGAYRNDSLGRTFVIPWDSTNEYVLQDLSKNAGDSVYNVIYANFFPGPISSYTFYVDSVDHITIGPYYLKRMYLTNAYLNQQLWGPPPLVWIEKVGCMGGGFINNMTLSMSGLCLNCMSFNDTIYYRGSIWSGPDTSSFYTYGSCVIPIKVPELSEDNQITISPNPFTSQTTISFSSDEWHSIKIMDVTGLMVNDKWLVVNGKSVTLDLSGYAKGIYYLRIEDKKKNVVNRKLVVQ